MTVKKFFRQLIEGIVVGFAFVSGMGGGTVAVLIGIYDDLVDAIADFPKTPGKSIKRIWVWVIGLIIGILALVYPITWLLENYPFPTITFIAGLTLGGFRELTNITKGHINWKNILLMIIGVIIPVSFAVISWFTTGADGIVINNLDFVQVIILIAVGLMLAAAVVAPGISGTQFLISIGYVGPLTLIITNMFNGINVGLGVGVLLIIVFSILIGLILVSKLTQWLLKKWYVPTYYVILGFILGSIFASYFNGDIKGEYAAFAGGFDWLTFIICLVCLVAGFVISYFLLNLANKKSKEPTEPNDAIEEQTNQE